MHSLIDALRPLALVIIFVLTVPTIVYEHYPEPEQSGVRTAWIVVAIVAAHLAHLL